nr:hypothetical protein [Mycoplasma zalophi]
MQKLLQENLFLKVTTIILLLVNISLNLKKVLVDVKNIYEASNFLSWSVSSKTKYKKQLSLLKNQFATYIIQNDERKTSLDREKICLRY